MFAEIVEFRDNKLTLERPRQEELTTGDGPGNIFGSANESITYLLNYPPFESVSVYEERIHG